MLAEAQRQSSLSPWKKGRVRARAGLHEIPLSLSRREREKRQVEP
jgi:hypothetical protein